MLNQVAFFLQLPGCASLLLQREAPASDYSKEEAFVPEQRCFSVDQHISVVGPQSLIATDYFPAAAV